MTDREHIQKLLGGYATGTLTPEEQQALFEAALADQEIFDALAREQSLRDLLRDPAARAQLLASMDDVPLPWYRRFWRPLVVAAAAVAVLGTGIYVMREKTPAALPVLVARVNPQPPPVMERREPAPVVANRPAAAEAPKAKVVRREPPVPAPPAPMPAAIPPPQAAPQNEVAAAAPVIAAEKKNAAEASDAAMVAGSVGGAAQANFLSAGSKQIPLPNAQALFYGQPQTASPQAKTENSPLREQKASPRAQQTAPAQAKDMRQQIQALGAIQAFAAPIRLGVKWTVLQQRDGGAFVEVEPTQLQAGDAVVLRLIPNENGFISVWEGTTALVQATRVERLKKLEIPVRPESQPGTKILTVQFSRMPIMQTGIVRAVVDQQSASDSQEHSTYVLNGNASQALPVSVTISLTFQ